jgi:hypothetical protein
MPTAMRNCPSRRMKRIRPSSKARLGTRIAHRQRLLSFACRAQPRFPRPWRGSTTSIWEGGAHSLRTTSLRRLSPKVWRLRVNSPGP